MSFHVLPFGRTEAGPAEGPAGEVVELFPEIPAHVHDEIAAAAELWHSLRARDEEIRFETSRRGERVSAELRDRGGAVVRALPLRQVVGLDGDGPQSAA